MIGVKSPELDSIDARRMRDMIASTPFQQFEKRLQAELNRAVATCERCDIAVELHRAQGAAAALRTAILLPALILAEIEKNR